ncbi:MAG: ABC transporter permease [Eubacteriales bacterium]|nr:ABC transporter permease [Eubacteriales bacterium]
MTRTKYLLGEAVRMALLLAAVSVAAFVLITKAPIDPLVSYIGTNSTLSQEAKDEISEYWGLDDPLPQRFVTWAGHALQGDLGESITYKKPVLSIIRERFSYSFGLMLTAWTLSGILGFLVGTACGIFQGSPFDRAVKVFCLGVKSAPTFWLGLLILTVFAVQLGWFPIGMAAPVGKLASEVTLGDRLYHLALPAFTLTIVSMSEVVLYTRQKLSEIMSSDFILYARARGESRGQIIVRHALRNIALPAVTVQFASFSELFGGMALAENVFSYPGIGTATTAAAMNGDVPLLLGLALCSAVFVFAGNLIANLLYGVFDPRIREGSGHA